MRSAMRSPPTPTPHAPTSSQPAQAAPSSFDWDEAIRAHNRRVVVHLLARGLSLDDAEDVAQRAWTRLIALDKNGRLPFIQMPGLAVRQATFLAASLKRDSKQHGALEDELVV